MSRNRVFRSITIILDNFGELDRKIMACEAEVQRWRNLTQAEHNNDLRERLRDLTLEERCSQQKVEGILEDISSPIRNTESQVALIYVRLDSDRQLEILRWLSTVPYQQHQNQHFRQVLQGTGTWFLEDSRLRQWHDSNDSCVLWLRGDPGFGKTKLIRNEAGRSQAAHVLRSIARQMSRSSISRSVLPPLLKLYEKQRDDGFAAGDLGLQEYVELIIQLAYYWPTITIIIDALDECDSISREVLLQHLDKLVQSSSSTIKILISSRLDQTIAYHLKSVPNILIHWENNYSDIARYIDVKVGNMVEKQQRYGKPLSDQLLLTVKDSLIEKSGGMFRWAEFSIEALNKLTLIDFTKELLGRIPESLEELYEQGYQQLLGLRHPEEVTVFENTIRLLLGLDRQLCAQDFLKAISLALNRQIIYTIEELLELCMNFVIYDDQADAFRFAHLSVQEFFEDRDDFLYEFCDECVIVVCLRFLMSQEMLDIREHAWNEHSIFSTGQISHEILRGKLDWETPTDHFSWIEARELSRYAISFWPIHLMACPSRWLVEPLRTLSVQFFLDQASDDSAYTSWLMVSNIALLYYDESSWRHADWLFVTPWNVVNFYTPTDLRRYIQAADPIYIQCFLNLTHFIEARLELDTEILQLRYLPWKTSYHTEGIEDILWENTRSMTHLACLRGGYDCVKLLLEKGSPVEWCTIKHALTNERLDIFELLLSHCGKPSAEESRLLFYISEFRGVGVRTSQLRPGADRRRKLVDVMLQYGADPDVCISETSPLDLAIENGDVALTTLLAKTSKHNAAPKIKAARLIHTARFGSCNQLKASLGKLPFEDNLAEYLGACLYAATESDSMDKVQMLLRCGIDATTSQKRFYNFGSITTKSLLNAIPIIDSNPSRRLLEILQQEGAASLGVVKPVPCWAEFVGPDLRVKAIEDLRMIYGSQTRE
ncbi:uncharacterized protein KY384_004765 [Bacidia gigantensis]|uniref:uncharacterized protein n=1 Tax=Bacidia gigantensis TaxID=2732470 RepID=UPI001D03AB87|nr:uncharacterized protein KY384_004765 [Bacidia gigantensis]KAG8530264.1 hypothetical protein KY384_004765 [Bacidia gigantensis]